MIFKHLQKNILKSKRYWSNKADSLRFLHYAPLQSKWQNECLKTFSHYIFNILIINIFISKYTEFSQISWRLLSLINTFQKCITIQMIFLIKLSAQFFRHDAQEIIMDDALSNVTATPLVTQHKSKRHNTLRDVITIINTGIRTRAKPRQDYFRKAHDMQPKCRDTHQHSPVGTTC